MFSGDQVEARKAFPDIGRDCSAAAKTTPAVQCYTPPLTSKSGGFQAAMADPVIAAKTGERERDARRSVFGSCEPVGGCRAIKGCDERWWTAAD